MTICRDEGSCLSGIIPFYELVNRILAGIIAFIQTMLTETEREYNDRFETRQFGADIHPA